MKTETMLVEVLTELGRHRVQRHAWTMRHPEPSKVAEPNRGSAWADWSASLALASVCDCVVARCAANRPGWSTGGDRLRSTLARAMRTERRRLHELGGQS